MNEAMKEKITNILTESNPNFTFFEVKTDDFVFEERIKMNCFYCGKYDVSWKCPPKIPDIDYKKMFSEFDNAMMVMISLDFDENSYSDVRTESSVILHKALLSLEKLMWENNFSTSLSFIGGSCKLCKNGCSTDKCRNPYNSRTPLEATGVNVVKTAKKYGVDISFPPKNEMKRIGLLLW